MLLSTSTGNNYVTTSMDDFIKPEAMIGGKFPPPLSAIISLTHKFFFQGKCALSYNSPNL